ncbi:hypothetical protein WJX81_004560 [Elliptochloris bilobata]|uniref:FHA domain-containing protein n=1 Tax=Elliptochloris bilobata TaxID=381761 RepID=A0AAW1QNM8_9CHLO
MLADIYRKVGRAASPPPPRHKLSPPSRAAHKQRARSRSRSRELAKRQRHDASPPRRPERRGGDAQRGDDRQRRHREEDSGARARRSRSRSPPRRLPLPPSRPPNRAAASPAHEHARGFGDEPMPAKQGAAAPPPPPPPPPPPRLPHEDPQDCGGRGGGGRGGGGRGGGRGRGEGDAPAVQVDPNFGLSGKLAEETNTVRGVVLLHTEPPEARKPTLKWRLYIFKAGTLFGDPLYIHRQSSYLFGREHRVVDVPTDHPSCSKQHAVLQYRLIEKEDTGTAVRPYMMDLGSTNGTFLNDERLDPQRYYELLEKDMIKFGNSSREYVLIHEKSG